MAVQAPEPEAIEIGNIFKNFSQFFNPNNAFNVKLKTGANGEPVPLIPVITGDRLSFRPATENDVHIPQNLLKSKFKETVCADSKLDPNVECPDVRFHRYPLFDGTCNNRIDINRGKAFRPLKRLVPAKYDDGFQARVNIFANL